MKNQLNIGQFSFFLLFMKRKLMACTIDWSKEIVTKFTTENNSFSHSNSERQENINDNMT